MAIFRGTGGAGDSTDDSIVSEVTEQAGIATTKAQEAATSATNASNSASSASSSETAASASAVTSQAAADAATVQALNALAKSLDASASKPAAAASATAAADSATAANSANVQTVAGLSTEITNLNGIRTDITGVNAVRADVVTVSGISSDVTTVAADASDIGTVATNITNVNNVGDNISNVNAVHSNASNINTVAADGSDIGTVASNISNVNTVAGISSDVTTVAGLESKMDAVIADASDIGAVAGNIGNVNTVAGDSSDINTVAGISADVTSVADNMTDVQNADTNAANAATSASNASDSASAASTSASSASSSASSASTSATNAGNSATTASNSATAASASKDAAASSASAASGSASAAASSASAASTSASNAATSETNAASSASAAATSATNAATSETNAAASATDSSNAASTWSNYYNTYVGASSSEPTVDVQGNALVAGALYFNTTNNTTYVWTGSAWNAVANNNIINPNVALTQDLATNGNDIKFGDNDKATFGAGDDLQIYHNGSKSIIHDVTAGNLEILADDFVIKNATGVNTLFYADAPNGAVSLYHSNAEKLATTSTGIDVTGTATMDGLTVDGNGKFSGTTPIVRLTETDTTNLNTRLAHGGGYFFVSTENDAESANTPRISLNHSTGDISFYEDTGTTPKLFWDASAERLGIGTSSPSEKLELTGWLKVGSGANEVGGVIFPYSTVSSNSRSYAWRNDVSAYGDFSLLVSDTQTGSVKGGTKVISVRNNNVGIGTSSPSQKLHLQTSDAGSGAGEVAIKMTVPASQISAQNEIRSGVTGGTNPYMSFAVRETSAPYATVERMRIDSSGNVGIGGAPAAVTHGPHLDLVGNRGTLTVGTGYFEDNGTTNFIGGARSLAFGAGGSGERMRIDSSGSVGIGTSSPNRVLHVEGTATTFGSTRSVLQIADDTAMAAGVGGGLTFTGKATTGQGDANTAFAAIHGLKENGTSTNTAGAMLFSTRTSGSSPAERMRIDSSGNLLVGKSSGAFATAGTAIYNSGLAQFTRSNASVLQANRIGGAGKIAVFFKGGVEHGSIGVENSGYMFIGNNDTNLAFSADSDLIFPRGNNGAQRDASIDLGNNSNRFKDLYLSGGVKGNNLTFSGNGSSEHARIDTSGHLLVGSSNASNTVAGFRAYSGGNGAFTVAGQTLELNRLSSDGSILGFQKDGTNVGSISVTGSATSYNTSSDQRLKENIADADDAGSKIDAIQVRKYDWKADGSHQDYGMIAQELLEVVPEAVSVPEDSEEMMGVDYSKLVPMLIKEIQSLRNRVAQLEE